MIDIPLPVAVIGAGILVGLAKGGLGPMGVLITPLMMLALPGDMSKQAVGLVLLMLIVGDWFAMYAYWRKWDGGRVQLLLVGAVVGIVLGSLLLGALPSDGVRRLVGIIGLLMAAYTVVERQWKRFEYRPRDWHGTFAGGAAGFTSSLANAGGAPFNAYMLLQELKPQVYVATATLFFTTVNILKLPLFLLNGALRFELLPSALPGMLFIPFGVLVGKLVVDRINRSLFELMIWVGLIISSVLLLIR